MSYTAEQARADAKAFIKPPEPDLPKVDLQIAYDRIRQVAAEGDYCVQVSWPYMQSPKEGLATLRAEGFEVKYVATIQIGYEGYQTYEISWEDV